MKTVRENGQYDVVSPEIVQENIVDNLTDYLRATYRNRMDDLPSWAV